MSDKRQSQRFKISANYFIFLSNDIDNPDNVLKSISFNAQLIDISFSGAAFSTTTEITDSILAGGQSIVLLLDNDNNKNSDSFDNADISEYPNLPEDMVLAYVVWTKKYEFGLCFSDPSDEFREQLEDLLKDLDPS